MILNNIQDTCTSIAFSYTFPYSLNWKGKSAISHLYFSTGILFNLITPRIKGESLGVKGISPVYW